MVFDFVILLNNIWSLPLAFIFLKTTQLPNTPHLNDQAQLKRMDNIYKQITYDKAKI